MYEPCVCISLLEPAVPRGTTCIFYWLGRGGGGGSGGVCGPKNFLGAMKDGRTFLCWEKKAQGFFWVLYFSLVQINNNIINTHFTAGVGFFWVC